ncbi:class I SAM-dependent methyltransferase [Gulosibacter molinativorax]|uniref:Class I SAM-dependent methyltransferase n=1 Tax=Gulosibacter molinativorax TaxID=256821 RepID=A0ABT7C5R5_9MICO|nr:class I SAM-dependent methyltransferase [Gulosibacter molinativorax]MDJ1370021.1 class I SAM-dependent methyltransferase [Gulosibacter molinativorax]QUY63789.1 Putative SAM-dependant methyltransferase [Gulosibacter molinativorax]
MDREDLTALLTSETMRLLDEFADLATTRDALGAVTSLRKAGVDARTSAAILTQLKLRRKAKAKFGDFAGRMLFTEDGLAQATRLQVAAHHGNRFRAAEVRRIADLGCGIGADAMTFAALGFDVVAVEMDEVTAAIATHNLAPFPNAEVRHARAEDIDLAEFDGVFLDPARRTAREGSTEHGASRRLADPADWSPSLDFAFGTMGEDAARAVGVKLGPAIPHELLPDDGEAQWVSVGGELVECAVWLGPAAREGVRRSVLSIRDGKSNELSARTSADEAVDAPVGDLGEWLHEPDPAIIRARFIGDLARQLGGRMIAPEIAWITTDESATSPFAQSFRVLEQFKLDKQVLKRELKARGIGTLEIKVRGVDLDPAAFRKQLALKGDASATLICTRVGDRRVALLAERA